MCVRAATSITRQYADSTSFVAVLAARSEKMEEINSALYTLMLTNVAMAVTTLVLGFQPNPGMTFQECVLSLNGSKEASLI